MKRIFEFVCDNSHISESFIDESVRAIKCTHCSKDAGRIISRPRIKLEGITGDYPTAYDAWERKRAEKLAIERKQNGTENL